MQVKHPPNQITAVYNVTSTTSATALCHSNAISYCNGMVIDGERVDAKNSHIFPSIGEHQVQFLIKKDKTDFKEFFFGVYDTLISLDFSDFRNTITSAYRMFSNCTGLESIIGLNGGQIHLSDASSMFYSCSKLKSLDVSKWDMSGAADVSYMFRFCKALGSLDVSKWDLSNVTNANYFFADCQSLQTLNVSNWSLSRLIQASNMFDNCKLLRSLDASKWDLSSVTNAYRMFYRCSVLEELRFNTEINQSINLSGVLSSAGITSPSLYYYPHVSFVETFLPQVPDKWQKIDITTLE